MSSTTMLHADSTTWSALRHSIELNTSSSKLAAPSQSSRLARILILFITLLLLIIFVAGILAYPGYSSSHPEKFSIYTWNVEQMSQMLQRVGLSYEWWLAFNLVISVITAAAFFSVAVLLYLRKRTDWFGLYLAFTLFLFGIALTPVTQVIAGQYPYLSSILEPLSGLAWPLFFIIFLIFPDGHFVPRWTRGIVLVILITWPRRSAGSAPHGDRRAA